MTLEEKRFGGLRGGGSKRNTIQTMREERQFGGRGGKKSEEGKPYLWAMSLQKRGGGGWGGWGGGCLKSRLKALKPDNVQVKKGEPPGKRLCNQVVHNRI